jgi:hypothetical protein
MTSIDRRPLLVVAATLGALAPAAGALAASASAAALQADRACYVNTSPGTGAPMTITGSGFTPGDTIDVSGGDVFTRATVGTTGVFTATANAPILSTEGPGTLKTTLTATDETTGAPVTSTVVESANLAVSVKPMSVSNVRKDKVTFTFSGFTPGKHIYGYYARKRIVARSRFGKAGGPCGTLRQRALLFPGGRPRNDKYTVTFESVSRYAKKAFPRVTGQLSILHF